MVLSCVFCRTTEKTQPFCCALNVYSLSERVHWFDSYSLLSLTCEFLAPVLVDLAIFLLFDLVNKGVSMPLHGIAGCKALGDGACSCISLSHRGVTQC